MGRGGSYDFLDSIPSKDDFYSVLKSGLSNNIWAKL